MNTFVRAGGYARRRYGRGHGHGQASTDADATIGRQSGRYDPMTTVENPRNTGLGKSVGVGLLIGVGVWVAYFIQASAFDGFGWQVTVLPAMVLIVAGVTTFGSFRPAARRNALGVTIGIGSAVLLALIGFVALFAGLDLE
jgi:hypothetical protein